MHTSTLLESAYFHNSLQIADQEDVMRLITHIVPDWTNKRFDSYQNLG